MKILVELDAILDTRLPVVATIDPDAAARLVVSPEYYHRQSDNFSAITKIPHETYLKAYANRSDIHVQGSRVTNIVLMLRELTKHLVELSIHEPTDEQLIIDVNLYPYKLDEFVDGICAAVATPCSPTTIVNPVRFSPDQMSPGFLKKQYNAVILYNFDEWFSKNSKAFESVQMPNVTVFAPALYRKDLPELDEEDMNHLNGKDPFALIEESHLFFLRLQFLDAKDYSILQYWEIPEKSRDDINIHNDT